MFTDRQTFFQENISHQTNTLHRPRQIFAHAFCQHLMLFLYSQAGRASLRSESARQFFYNTKKEQRT